MSDTIRIGILGLSHDHIWGELHALAPLEGQQLLVAADPAQELRDKVAAEFGCETTDSYDAVIERDDVDAVFVYGSNRTGAEIAAKAAAAGKHVMIEKPMAADLAGAEKLLKAAEEANVKLMVNWPCCCVAARPAGDDGAARCEGEYAALGFELHLRPPPRPGPAALCACHCTPDRKARPGRWLAHPQDGGVNPPPPLRRASCRSLPAQARRP
ncbi:MAG: Gfo/Idh/MocA family oxidoreductase [Verrucomicrobiota bacterium]